MWAHARHCSGGAGRDNCDGSLPELAYMCRPCAFDFNSLGEMYVLTNCVTSYATLLRVVESDAASGSQPEITVVKQLPASSTDAFKYVRDIAIDYKDDLFMLYHNPNSGAQHYTTKLYRIQWASGSGYFSSATISVWMGAPWVGVDPVLGTGEAAQRFRRRDGMRNETILYMGHRLAMSADKKHVILIDGGHIQYGADIVRAINVDTGYTSTLAHTNMVSLTR